MLCLGDYIYERHYYNGPAARVDHTGVNGDGKVQTLAEYRQKFRFYQTDPNLQAMHAAFPFVSVWDDHEVEDNYAGDGPDSLQPDVTKENNGTPSVFPSSSVAATGTGRSSSRCRGRTSVPRSSTGRFG